jgi:uncharacterized protein YecE (DUF72 family)
MKKGNYYTGTSGLLLPYKNQQFYPAEFQGKSRLAVYGALFNSIEVNSTFYKLPMQTTIQKWAESVPAHFKFTFKLWREITHQKELQYNGDDVRRFMEIIAAAGDKKGCLLVQFPPGIRYNSLPRVKKLLAAIIKSDPHREWKLSVEFRHASWYREETYRLLDGFEAGMVIHDKTHSETPLEDMDLPFVYVRFHGPAGDYKGSYDDSFLYEYAHYIRDWRKAGKDVYVYFNNTIGDALKNLDALKSYVENDHDK